MIAVPRIDGNFFVLKLGTYFLRRVCGQDLSEPNEKVDHPIRAAASSVEII
jgi:hypothetical protein